MIPLPPPRHVSALRGPLSAGLVLLSAIGCATPQRTDIVWPPPPEKGRVQFVRTIQLESDLSPSFGRRFLKALFPHESRAVIQTPTGLALSPDEKRLYVACGGGARVIVVDLEASTLDVFAGSTTPAPLATTGIAVDGAGAVYVADRLTNQVFVYDREGRFLRKFGSDRLKIPIALAIDRDAQQLYALSGTTSGNTDHTIEVYSLTGSWIRTIGKRGDGQGQFNFATGVTVAPDGKLWVADMLNFRVQVFDREGSFQSTFGKLGTGGVGAFDKIRSVAFDSFQNVYVVDAAQGVQVFNPNLQPLLIFGQVPFLNVPGPIVIDRKNRIFVGDFGTNKVFQFQLVNTSAEDSYLKPEAPPGGTDAQLGPSPAEQRDRATAPGPTSAPATP